MQRLQSDERRSLKRWLKRREAGEQLPPPPRAQRAIAKLEANREWLLRQSDLVKSN